MIKAIFFDIDGTLQTLENPAVVPPSTTYALKKLRENNIKIFIATGRPPTIIDEIVDKIGVPFDGYVTMNGQYCYDETGIIRETTIPVEELRKAIAFLEERELGTCIAEKDYVYISRDCPRIRAFMGHNEYTNLDDISRIETHKVFQLMTFIEEQETDLEEEFFSILTSCKSARWTPHFMDVIPKEGGKNKGIDAMLEHYHFDLSESMAFGDGGNDIDMIKHVHIGVAMGNANDRVKEAADYVTEDIKEDGLALALKHFKLI